MLFILEEDIMNGTVKIDSIISGIEAVDFIAAKEILKNKLVEDNFLFEEQRDEIIWVVKGSVSNIYGRMRNKPLNIINKE